MSASFFIGDGGATSEGFTNVPATKLLSMADIDAMDHQQVVDNCNAAGGVAAFGAKYNVPAAMVNQVAHLTCEQLANVI